MSLTGNNRSLAHFASASDSPKRGNDLHNKNEIHLFKWGRKKEIKEERKKKKQIAKFPKVPSFTIYSFFSTDDSAHKRAAKDQCSTSAEMLVLMMMTTTSPLFFKVGGDGEKCSYSWNWNIIFSVWENNTKHRNSTFQDWRPKGKHNTVNAYIYKQSKILNCVCLWI